MAETGVPDGLVGITRMAPRDVVMKEFATKEDAKAYTGYKPPRIMAHVDYKVYHTLMASEQDRAWLESIGLQLSPVTS